MGAMEMNRKKTLLVLPGILISIYAMFRIAIGLQNYQAAKKYKHEHPGDVIDLRETLNRNSKANQNDTGLVGR